MWRALKLDRSLYEEVEHDESASRQVIVVVAVVAAAQALGLSLTSLILGERLGGILVGAILEFFVTLVGLFIWSYLIYLVGTKLFKGVATQQETWRTAGFARSPGLFS
ncbi:MAG: YIP1 family protein [Thaumarchaeota archaeon]|nr:YIP1 family protein [Nitrososphaerota archaeon]